MVFCCLTLVGCKEAMDFQRGRELWPSFNEVTRRIGRELALGSLVRGAKPRSGVTVCGSAFSAVRPALSFSPVTLSRVVFAAHDGCVLEPRASSLAVWLNVVDGEVVPGEFLPALLAALLRGRIPQHTSLLWRKATPLVLPLEQRF